MLKSGHKLNLAKIHQFLSLAMVPALGNETDFAQYCKPMLTNPCTGETFGPVFAEVDCGGEKPFLGLCLIPVAGMLLCDLAATWWINRSIMSICSWVTSVTRLMQIFLKYAIDKQALFINNYNICSFYSTFPHSTLTSCFLVRFKPELAEADFLVFTFWGQGPYQQNSSCLFHDCKAINVS